MTDLLLLEDGDSLLLEDGDSLLLESSADTPTVVVPGKALWDTGYTLFIELAVDATVGSSGVWDDGLWDTATWGPDVAWTDISRFVFAWASTLGRSRENGRSTAANGHVEVDDKDGDFLPENLAGPYVAAGVTGVRPGRPIRGYVRHDLDDTIFPLFYGVIDDFTETIGSKAPRITFLWVDDIAALSGVDGYEQLEQGGGELVGPRLHRLLDAAEHDGPRDIDLGATTMQPTTLAQNAWTEVVLTADSDGGDVWIDPDRTFRFLDREGPIRNTRSNTVQWTFTDADTPGALHYDHIEIQSGMDILVNQVALARAGGTVRTDTDLTSRALYGLRRWGRNDLICESDSQVDTLIAATLTRQADPTRKPRAITLNPRVLSNLWPAVLGMRRWDRCEVTRQHERSGVTITHECFIDGIEHTMTDGGWSTVVRLASTAGYPRADQLGVWDSSLWDEAFWGVDA